MAIGVKGDGDGGVSQQFLDELRMHIPLKQERGASVTQVVEGDLRKACTLQERFEGSLSEVGGVDEPATLASEDETLITVKGTLP